jgi:hypothetical protein
MIQACLSAPYLFQLPRSFGRFLFTTILPFVLSVRFFTFSTGSHVGTFADCFFLHLANGYECGIASTDGASKSLVLFGDRRGLVFFTTLIPNPKLREQADPLGAIEYHYRIYGQRS